MIIKLPSSRRPILSYFLHDGAGQQVHAVVGAEFVQGHPAVPVLDADGAHVPFDRMALGFKGHGKAPVSLLDRLSQSDRVVVAGVGAPDGLALEIERAREGVSFDRVRFVLCPDLHRC